LVQVCLFAAVVAWSVLGAREVSAHDDDDLIPQPGLIAVDNGGELLLVDLDGTVVVNLGEGSATFAFRPGGAWSHDGTLIVYSRPPYVDDIRMSQLVVARSDGSNPVVVSDEASLGYWSPTENHLLFRLGDDVGWEVDTTFLVNADGSGRRVLFQGLGGAWSPDGKLISYFGYTSSSESEWRIYELATGLDLQVDVPQGVNACLTGSPWSPDSTRMLVTRTVYSITTTWIYDVVSGTLTELLADERACSWAPRGNLVAYRPYTIPDAEEEVRLIDVDTRVVTRLETPLGEELRWWRWSPTGDHLVVMKGSGWPEYEAFVYVNRTDGSVLWSSHDSGVEGIGQTSHVVWAPDGSGFLIHETLGPETGWTFVSLSGKIYRRIFDYSELWDLPPFWQPVFPQDISTSVFKSDLGWLWNERITRGCNPPFNDHVCPQDPVTRAQMAAFLVRALGLTDRLDDPFTDDDNSIFESDIEKLAAAGITRGCNPPANDMFCPDQKVTREQMAAFLVRAFGYTDDGGGNLFTDDDESIFKKDIDRLATAGVTKGCNPPTNDLFCPTSYVTRGQMAAFLHRALG
jgi:Tol biopolymer transport system component